MNRGTKPSRADAPPSLLFLMTDHQRADSIGMVQAGVEVCPTLNRLATEGAQFTRAYNACPLCVPARTALATGTYPTHNGVVFNDWKGVRAGDYTPCHEVLANTGYAVAHIGVDHIRVKPGLRERVEFRHWTSNREYNAYLKEQGIDPNPEEGIGAFKRAIHENQGGERVPVQYSNTCTALWESAAEHFKDHFFCAQASAFLRETEDRPFALFLYLWAPHPPLRVPEPYASLFDPAEIDLPTNVGHIAEGEPPNRRLGIAAQLAEELTELDWREVWAAHLGLVRLADDGIAQVLQTLRDMGYAENTLVAFTSDHGDHLGQHRMYQKMEMYEQAIRVPLLFVGPGVKTQQVARPVSHLDVMPTLLGLLRLPQVNGLDGRSLAECIRAGEVLAERPVYSQYSGNLTVGDLRRAIITERYKYVYDPEDRAELYDLQQDPLEMLNLAGDPGCRAIQQSLHEACRDWAETHGDWVEFSSRH